MKPQSVGFRLQVPVMIRILVYKNNNLTKVHRCICVGSVSLLQSHKFCSVVTEMFEYITILPNSESV